MEILEQRTKTQKWLKNIALGTEEYSGWHAGPMWRTPYKKRGHRNWERVLSPAKAYLGGSIYQDMDGKKSSLFQKELDELRIYCKDVVIEK